MSPGGTGGRRQVNAITTNHNPAATIQPTTDASARNTKLTIQHPAIQPAVAQARSGPN